MDFLEYIYILLIKKILKIKILIKIKINRMRKQKKKLINYMYNINFIQVK